MYTTLDQTDITEFASDSSAVKEAPASARYKSGVEVNYTAPAKWWNYLLGMITRSVQRIKNDKQSIIAEMKNLLTDASITPDSSDEHQLSKAIDTKAYADTEAYDNKTVTETVGTTSVTHKVNQPYVKGHTLYIPDTELL